MATEPTQDVLQSDYLDDQYDEAVDRVGFDFSLSRRRFVQMLGAGLLIAVCEAPVIAQATRGAKESRGVGKGQGTGRPAMVAARVHIAKDGTITVLTGKVEGGQGARTELTQAAAEELRVPAERIILIMADTDLVPDDGLTAGSGSTPRTVPAVRQGTSAARDLLVQLACKTWSVPEAEVEVRDGKVVHAPSRRELSYADLASGDEIAKAFQQTIPSNVILTPVKEWKVMGTPVARPNRREFVTGAHQYPSDITRPGMLHGKVLRAPSYGAKLASIDLAPAKAMKDVAVVQDGSFVGIAAPTTFMAQQALDAIAATAKWEETPHPSSNDLYTYLRQHAQVPTNPFADDVAAAARKLKQTYHVAYVQHAPLEPRAAVAEWNDGKVTVWTGSQNPFGVRSELTKAFRLSPEQARVIVPDFGAGFGGKHSGECAVEAARLAQGTGKPVSLRWTRREEFTWAYFRPAAVIDIEAGLDAQGAITSWHHIDINAGSPGIETPYRIPKAKSQAVGADSPPLRQGSYRALGSTGNNFARECAMDELAEAAGRDPLEFRLAHLENPRIRAVLKEAAKQFDWAARSKKKDENVGVGLACGTEKGSVVAACVEVAIDKAQNRILVRHVCQAFECGAIINPDNLMSQVKGAIIMGLGPALREEMRFENGKMLNASFIQYLVPRFEDVPQLDIHLLNRPDQPSNGAGETPIIAVAPAIANAVFRITGQRLRQMPLRLPVPGR